MEPWLERHTSNSKYEMKSLKISDELGLAAMINPAIIATGGRCLRSCAQEVRQAKLTGSEVVHSSHIQPESIKLREGLTSAGSCTLRIRIRKQTLTSFFFHKHCGAKALPASEALTHRSFHVGSSFFVRRVLGKLA